MSQEADGVAEAIAGEPKRGRFRLAAYAVCIEGGRVLLAHHASKNWTLPGGRVEHAEDPFDAVIREVAEETGCDAVVERLLGVDSRVIPAAVARVGVEHQNVGIFYQVRSLAANSGLSRMAKPSSRSGLRSPRSLASADHRWSTSDWPWRRPFRRHVTPVPVGGLIRH